MKTIHFEEGKKVNGLESENTDTAVANLCNGAGLLACACLIVYFFVMSSFNLQNILLLRGFNFVFLLGAILLVLHLYSKSIEDKIEYFKGIKLGVWVTLATVLPFAVFMGIYLAYDNNLLNVIREHAVVGKYMNQLTVAVAICIEGISSGIIMTFIAMQYYKKE